ncbi:MAG: adenosine kinase [Ignavibacteria bacterium]|jgi:sugar/nucleoside kinase (ribokinase family)|nr:adenosine kinase [Ignavibacteria bacterium]
MKTLQLTAIGNGVVDMQYQISEELFATLNVPKGEMRLVEPDEQLAIIAKLHIATPNKCSGGSATNSVDCFAKFGGKAAYLTAVGDDANGKFYYDELEQCGIKYKPNVIKNASTGTCLVLITPDGERTMLTCLAASKEFSEVHLDATLIADAEWLYIEGYKFSETAGVECIMKSLEIAENAGTKIAITASDVFIIDIFREQFMSALEHCDLLFCNENEANRIANTTDYSDAIVAISKICKNIVMTRGKDGATILYDGKRYDIASIAVKAVDTTGAGDMFAGAFFYGLLNEMDIATAGKLASKSAAAVVSQLGARYAGDFSKLKEI